MGIGLCLLWGMIPGCSSVQSNPQLDPPWQSLFAGSEAQKWQITNFGGEGEVEWADSTVLLPMGSPLTGIHRPDSIPQSLDYQVEVDASRLSGNDFFCGLTFPVADSHATVVLGGWGGGLCGLSCVDHEDAGTNATRSYQSFDYGVVYTLRVEVRADTIRAWLNGELLFDQNTVGREVSLRTEMLPSVPFGVASFTTRAKIHDVRWRPLSQS